MPLVPPVPGLPAVDRIGDAFPPLGECRPVPGSQPRDAASPLLQTSRGFVAMMDGPDRVPNGYRGLAGCANSRPDPNRATAPARAGWGVRTRHRR